MDAAVNICPMHRTQGTLLQNARDRKGIFLVQTAWDTEASRDIAVIGEAQKKRHF